MTITTTRYSNFFILSLSMTYIILSLFTSGLLGYRFKTIGHKILNAQYLGTKLFFIFSLILVVIPYLLYSSDLFSFVGDLWCDPSDSEEVENVKDNSNNKNTTINNNESQNQKEAVNNNVN